MLDARFGIKTSTVAFDLAFGTYGFALARNAGVVLTTLMQAIAAVIDIAQDIPAGSEAHLLTC